uniref:Reverse transcriptase domain-containing protein n=1 Tax=Amphimedon queenslandica TaxID=400682 RepID=A0A1X7VRC9_AMPQE
MLSGYWQVEVADSDKEKTAFVTCNGLYQFNVLPFGLCNGPATVQRLMDSVLNGVHWSTGLFYLDDVIVLGNSLEEHLINLAGVLNRLQKANLRMKPTKCDLFQKRILFLGHVVSQEWVASKNRKGAPLANTHVSASIATVFGSSELL